MIIARWFMKWCCILSLFFTSFVLAAEVDFLNYPEIENWVAKSPYELSRKINRHLTPASPRLSETDINQKQIQFAGSGSLELNKPLKLSAAEAGMLKDAIVANEEGLNSWFIPADLVQASGQLVGFGRNSLSRDRLLPVNSFPLQSSSRLTFSARPGFEYPFLILVYEKVVNLSHLRVDASNLPSTPGGCYLQEVVKVEFEGVEYDSWIIPEVLNLQKPVCPSYNGSGLLADGRVPMQEVVKGGRPNRAKIRQASDARKNNKKASGGGAAPPPPPPPSGGSAGAAGGDDGDGDKDKRRYKDDTSKPDEAEEDDENKEEEDKGNGSKKNTKVKGRRMKTVAVTSSANLKQLRRVFRRISHEVGRSRRRGKGAADRNTINEELAKATDDDWKEIVVMPGFSDCQAAFGIEVPSEYEKQFDWREQQKPSSDESEENSGSAEEDD
ncbi:hypothetical protein [Endozoicomonas lisbonensis]|uniref:Uncharacterized protein n=1 Tax=Endozoicomonas lisbonensis TaxID=3120522 RepID=A0ABV2SBT4_9GAMM